MTSRFDRELYRKHFRVTIFGSARIEKGDPRWKMVHRLAKMIGREGIDVVTGGGPGLMDAASSGHQAGRKDHHTLSIGLNIHLPKEQKMNRHLDVKKEFLRFSDRLDNFTQLSNVVVVAPGGVGTMLEFFFTWQLVQVGHISGIPIILMGKMWPGFVKWIKKNPLRNKFISRHELDNIFVARNEIEAMEVINDTYDEFNKSGKNISANMKKYRIR